MERGLVSAGEGKGREGNGVRDSREGGEAEGTTKSRRCRSCVSIVWSFRFQFIHVISLLYGQVTF